MSSSTRHLSRSVRACYVDVGEPSSSRFSRQWVRLSEDGISFHKDSLRDDLPPLTYVGFHGILDITSDPLRQCCIKLDTNSKKILLIFKSDLEVNAWKAELVSRTSPVLLIASNKDPFGTNVGDHEEDGIDEVTLASRRVKKKASNLSSLLLEGTTLGGSFSHFSKRDSDMSRFTFDPGTPQTCDIAVEMDALAISSYMSGLWTEEPDIIDYSANLDDGCPDEPVDPDLIFDSDRIRLAEHVSYSPGSRQRSPDLTGQVRRLGKHAFAIGGFADVWLGEWRSEDRIEIVAIKVIRSFLDDKEKVNKLRRRLCKELDIWRQLRHRNIIPLYGICNDRNLGVYASMISPWMQNGNAASYFKGRDIRETEVARFKLLWEVALGLEYLHCFSPAVIHGDLKASNILINDNGEALLSDFGISTVIEEATGSSYFGSSSTFAGSVRWMAFELLRPDVDPQLTTWCDIWSYGSTVLEILSGKLPYCHRKNDIQVLHEVALGLKPRREGTGISPDIWDFIQSCWMDLPTERPTASDVARAIGRVYKEKQRMGVLNIRDPGPWSAPLAL